MDPKPSELLIPPTSPLNGEAALHEDGKRMNQTKERNRSSTRTMQKGKPATSSHSRSSFSLSNPSSLSLPSLLSPPVASRSLPSRASSSDSEGSASVTKTDPRIKGTRRTKPASSYSTSGSPLSPQAANQAAGKRARSATIQGPAPSRDEIILQIVESERLYVDSLTSLIKHIAHPLKASHLPSSEQPILPSPECDDIYVLFQHAEDLLNHTKQIQTQLNNWKEGFLIGDIFARWTSLLQRYQRYTENYNRCLRVVDELEIKYPRFAALTKRWAEAEPLGGLKLHDFLIKPIQRVPKYRIFINDLLKHTDSTHPDFDNLTQSAMKMQEVGDESIRQPQKYITLRKELQRIEEDLAELKPTINVQHFSETTIPTRGLLAAEELREKQLEEQAHNDLVVFAAQQTQEKADDEQVDQLVANLLLLMDSTRTESHDLALSLLPRVVAMLGLKIGQFANEMWKLFVKNKRAQEFFLTKPYKPLQYWEEQRRCLEKGLMRLIDAVPVPDAQGYQATISPHLKEFLSTYMAYLLPYDETTKRTTNQIIDSEGRPSMTMFKILEKLVLRFWNQVQKLPRFGEMKLLASSKHEYYSLVKIGGGGFSKVYLGFQKHTAISVAIKVIELDDLRLPKNYKDEYVKPEIEITKSLDHENLMKMHDDIDLIDDERMIMIMEYCNSGTLKDIIEQSQKQRLSEQEIQGIVRQIASGCEKLRKQEISHRDLKPENIVVTREKGRRIIKIGDFGFSRQMVSTQAQFSTKIGTKGYTSPECLFKDEYGIKSDLIGVIIYEIVTGKLPFSEEDMKNMNRLKDVNDPKVAVTIPADIKPSRKCVDLIEKLLQADEKKRISWEAFFAHPFIQEDTKPRAHIPDDITSVILVIGDHFVGKSDLLIRYTQPPIRGMYPGGYVSRQKYSQSDARRSISEQQQHYEKIIEWGLSKRVVKLQFLESWIVNNGASSDWYSRMCYQNASGVIGVFDVTRPETLNTLQKWLTALQEEFKLNIPTLLLATKCDLDESYIKNNSDQLKEYCKKNNLIGLGDTSSDRRLDAAVRLLIKNITKPFWGDEEEEKIEESEEIEEDEQKKEKKEVDEQERKKAEEDIGCSLS